MIYEYLDVLEHIATDILFEAAEKPTKPNIPNRAFMNAIIIFQSALMDKLYDNQDFDNMPMEERIKMAESCGKELRKLIHTYTGLDTHNMEQFV